MTSTLYLVVLEETVEQLITHELETQIDTHDNLLPSYLRTVRQSINERFPSTNPSAQREQFNFLGFILWYILKMYKTEQGDIDQLKGQTTAAYRSISGKVVNRPHAYSFGRSG